MTGRPDGRGGEIRRSSPATGPASFRVTQPGPRAGSKKAADGLPSVRSSSSAPSEATLRALAFAASTSRSSTWNIPRSASQPRIADCGRAGRGSAHTGPTVGRGFRLIGKALDLGANGIWHPVDSPGRGDRRRACPLGRRGFADQQVRFAQRAVAGARRVDLRRRQIERPQRHRQDQRDCCDRRDRRRVCRPLRPGAVDGRGPGGEQVSAKPPNGSRRNCRTA